MDLRFIKNLYRKLITNSEEPDVEETEVQAQAPAPIRNRINKELEAKIIYDYPKGNFRFPLIPDERRPRERKLPLQEDAKKKQPVQRKEDPVKKREMPQKKVRPFTPTEVPSPIYGYSKPAKKEEVEYELSGFLATEENIPNGKEGQSGPVHPLEGVQNGRELPRDVGAPKRFREEDVPYIHMEKTPSTELMQEPIGNGLAVSKDVEPNAFLKNGPSQPLQGGNHSFNKSEQAQLQNGGTPSFDRSEHSQRQDVVNSSFDKDQQASLPAKEQHLTEEDALHRLLKEGLDELNGEDRRGIEHEPVEVISAVNVEALPLPPSNTESLPAPATEEGAEVVSAPAAEEKTEVVFEQTDANEIELVSESADVVKTEMDAIPAAEEKTEAVFEQTDANEIELVSESADEDKTEMDAIPAAEEKTEVVFEQTDANEIEVVSESADEDKTEMDAIPAAEEKTEVVFEQTDANGIELVSESTDVVKTEMDAIPAAEEKTEVVFEQTDANEIEVVSESAYEVKTEMDAISATREKTEVSSGPAAGLSATIATPAADPKPSVEKKQSAGRSHLPFNVLMLKQDKRKFEENRIKKNHVVNSNPMADKWPATIDKKNDDSVPVPDYNFPGMDLLNPPVKVEADPGWLEARRSMLDETLFNFNVGAKVVNVTQGPSVTRFEVHPEPGVKVSKVTNLSDDIKLSLAARDIRIEAPIPGKHTIGIEVPNPSSRPVLISEIIGSSVFAENPSPLTAVLGLDISGKPIVTDLKKMPHGLIAGATGSGKSVCINSILVSLLYKASPDDLKLLLIDPKMVELAPYNRIPHLVSPVITDVKAATASLKWAVEEMERRYELFAHAGVRDINRFNELALEAKRYSEKLPFIVIIIDELADLMMMSPADVEEAICRIAQKARACGIHLIIATQRPSVDVITGLIKANVPTRIAFSVSSQIDSRTIIDIGGAERLLGRGDMLFLENGSSKPVRLQGTFVSDAEIDKVVSFAREQRSPEYLFEQEELLKKAQVTEEEDELFYEACEFVVEQGGASTSSLQRRFKVGYNRAARLIDMMEEAGFISGARGSKPRDVLITEADLESMQEAGPVHY